MRHFDDDRFSAGAARVIRRAWGLARLRGMETVPADSFWDALQQEDGVAREWLESFGIVHPEPLTLSHMPAMPPVRMLSDDTQAAVAEADRIVREFGRHGVIGSEHLLYGVLATDQTRREAVAAEGLTLDEVTRRISEATGFSAEPLASDLKLSDSLASVDDRPVSLRVTDASLNRVAKGLRTVEDYCRFALDDASLTAALKTLRHDLRPVQRRVSPEERAAVRDVTGDVGTDIMTPTELARGTAADVARANLRRVCESLRSAEEYAKTLDGEVARMLETLRYRAYDVERRVLRLLESRQRLADARLYLLLGLQDLPMRWQTLADAALAGGVDVIQLREKNAGDRQLLDAARHLRKVTRAAGALLIINDRPDLAVMADADGVHLGQDDLPVAAVRRVVGARRLIGVSTHRPEDAEEATREGADYLGVGPTFPSQTKSFEQFAGLEYVRHAAALAVPAFAIGGITPDNVDQVTAAGLRRVAVSRAITHAEIPEQAARRLAAAVRSDDPACDLTLPG